MYHLCEFFWLLKVLKPCGLAKSNIIKSGDNIKAHDYQETKDQLLSTAHRNYGWGGSSWGLLKCGSVHHFLLWCYLSYYSSSPSHAEGMAVLYAMFWAWEKGLRNIRIHTASLELVQQLKRQSQSDVNVDRVLAHIFQLTALFMFVTFHYIPRGSNGRAHLLATRIRWEGLTHFLFL